ncbi:hypothetical protein SISNIDRAFT_467649 [Sistotremastrum niveocremeum HHB9708]|uniref:Uncharacterized protein n=1 Tax=Sistotremastrum niveocremeum HHB9708 TaxID=1314777 RepID=A0A164SEA3_9AGAM|nr:hypothetical protein SISNIDRAFT_467649 [Sistotremastrum niveocremeum HHB9708]
MPNGFKLNAHLSAPDSTRQDHGQNRVIARPAAGKTLRIDFQPLDYWDVRRLSVGLLFTSVKNIDRSQSEQVGNDIGANREGSSYSLRDSLLTGPVSGTLLTARRPRQHPYWSSRSRNLRALVKYSGDSKKLEQMRRRSVQLDDDRTPCLNALSENGLDTRSTSAIFAYPATLRGFIRCYCIKLCEPSVQNIRSRSLATPLWQSLSNFVNPSSSIDFLLNLSRFIGAGVDLELTRLSIPLDARAET